MEMRRLIFNQALMVFFLMGCVISVIELISYAVNGEWAVLPGYLPVSMLVIAVLTALPTVLFYIKPNLCGIKAKLLIAVHYILLFAIVMTSGRLFNWYAGIGGFLVMSAVFTVIYVLIWVFTAAMSRRDARIINEALDRIRDDE